MVAHFVWSARKTRKERLKKANVSYLGAYVPQLGDRRKG